MQRRRYGTKFRGEWRLKVVISWLPGQRLTGALNDTTKETDIHLR